MNRKCNEKNICIKIALFNVSLNFCDIVTMVTINESICLDTSFLLLPGGNSFRKPKNGVRNN